MMRNFKTERNWSQMRPAIVSGMVTWNARSAIGQFFPLYLVTVPEVFAKVNSAQLPFRF